MEEANILKKVISWCDSEDGVRLALLTGSFADHSVTDELSDYESLSLADIEANRAEVQRYFGYEDLMFRFTTLPYDV